MREIHCSFDSVILEEVDVKVICIYVNTCIYWFVCRKCLMHATIRVRGCVLVSLHASEITVLTNNINGKATMGDESEGRDQAQAAGVSFTVLTVKTFQI